MARIEFDVETKTYEFYTLCSTKILIAGIILRNRKKINPKNYVFLNQIVNCLSLKCNISQISRC